MARRVSKLGDDFTDRSAGKQLKVQVKAAWDDIEDMAIGFSDQLIVTHLGDYFLLTLGQVAQPQVLPGDSETMERLKERGKVQIRSQFRTAVPASAFLEFVRASSRLIATMATDPNPEDDEVDE